MQQYIFMFRGLIVKLLYSHCIVIVCQRLQTVLKRVETAVADCSVIYSKAYFVTIVGGIMVTCLYSS